MPLVRSLVSERCTHTVAVILLLSKIIPSCSRCAKKKLVYITIVAPSSHQPSFYIKCTKLNMHLSYNVQSVSNTEYS